MNCLDAELKHNKLSEGWIEREKSSASIGTYYTVHLHVLSRLLQFLSLKAERWHGAWGGGSGEAGNTIVSQNLIIIQKLYYLEDLL